MLRQERARRGRGSLLWPAAGVAAIFYGALLVYLRGSPALIRGDAGTFVSVAARLLKGDRLYADVFDNKDPLFFYAHAAALAMGGWRGPSALDALWLAMAAIAMAGFLRSVTGALWIAAFGFAAYPLLLTASWYSSGYSELAALALAPLVGWLAAGRRWVWAGVALSIGLLFKSNLGLVLLAAPTVLLVAQRRRGETRTSLARFAAGTGATLAIAALVLGLRGELGPYLGVLHENMHYANDVLAFRGRGRGIAGHLRIVRDVAPHLGRLTLLLAVAAVLGAWSYRRAARASVDGAVGTLGLVLAAAGSATVVTLALTAVWGHHMQVLAYGETLLLAYLAAGVSGLAERRLAVHAAGAVVAVAGLWLLGGFDPPALGQSSHERWHARPLQLTADALEQTATRYLPRQNEVSYARLGSNDDGHAAFLDDRFSLACARFHQYEFSRNLGSVVACMRSERPQLVVTVPPFPKAEQATDRWSRFVELGSALLTQRYRRVVHELTPYGALDVWVLRQPAATG